MKKDIHPTYFPQAKIVCACGNTLVTGSTKEETRVEICSNCHPYFTGKANLIDTQGTVEKFKGRLAKAQPKRATKARGTRTERVEATEAQEKVEA